MARSPTGSDAFNAAAEPRRRHILGLLAQSERPVNDLAGLFESLEVSFDWVRDFEPFWNHQLDRIKQSAERTAMEREPGQDTSEERG